MSVIGRLLVAVSWEKATYFRSGGKGRENVLTAEVFQALGLLPRTRFLGKVLAQCHGANAGARLLAEEVEAMEFTLFPGEYEVVKKSPDQWRRYLQPDGLIESPNVFCIVEAKRVKPGSFQREQLALEFLAVLKEARAKGKTPILLLVLPKGPPVRVSTRGASQQFLSIRDAIAGPLEELLPKTEPQYGALQEVLELVESVVGWVTWDETRQVVMDEAGRFASGDESIDASMARLARMLMTAIDWAGSTKITGAR